MTLFCPVCFTECEEKPRHRHLLTLNNIHNMNIWHDKLYLTPLSWYLVSFIRCWFPQIHDNIKLLDKMRFYWLQFDTCFTLSIIRLCILKDLCYFWIRQTFFTLPIIKRHDFNWYFVRYSIGSFMWKEMQYHTFYG